MHKLVILFKFHQGQLGFGSENGFQGNLTFFTNGKSYEVGQTFKAASWGRLKDYLDSARINSYRGETYMVDVITQTVTSLNDYTMVFSTKQYLEKLLMAYSHCTGLGLVTVQGMGLPQEEIMVLVPVPISDQCEHFCMIY